MPVDDRESVTGPSPGFLEAAQTLYVDGMTTEVVAALATAGIIPIVLKGPSIARWLYPSGGRTYGDTDLLVPAALFESAEGVLRSIGFASMFEGFDPFEHGPRIVETPLIRGRVEGTRSGGKVDLHRNLPGLPVADDLLWEVLIGECETMLLGGVEVRVLNRTGVALHIVVHALQHGFGFHTDEDLRRVIATLGPEEWQRVAALARRLGVGDIVGGGLRRHPDGAVVADRLGLGDAVPERSPYYWTCSQAPRGAEALATLVAAPTFREKARIVRWALAPSPAKVHFMSGTGDPGWRSLALAYLRHWRGMGRSLGPAARFVLARPEQRRSG